MRSYSDSVSYADCGGSSSGLGDGAADADGFADDFVADYDGVGGWTPAGSYLEEEKKRIVRVGLLIDIEEGRKENLRRTCISDPQTPQWEISMSTSVSSHSLGV